MLCLKGDLLYGKENLHGIVTMHCKNNRNSYRFLLAAQLPVFTVKLTVKNRKNHTNNHYFYGSVRLSPY
jgi:hypothetical protein